jgi:protein-S-isoprenylcysteine O-methyltransferase Ste14
MPQAANAASPALAAPETAIAHPAIANNWKTASESECRLGGKPRRLEFLKSLDQSLLVHTHVDVHTLELKIPPLGLVLVAGFLMWLGVGCFPTLNYRFPFQSLIACVIGLSGALICALGIIQFNRAKTTVNPTKPESASSLVRTGIYRRTRNPMYLGFLLILAGWAIAMANVVAFVVLPGFVIYMNQFQIKPEERALTLIFGDDFKAYCSEARRWI